MVEVDVHPFAPVTVTLKNPDVSTVIDGSVLPAFQTIFVAALDVSVTLLPAQKVYGPLALMVGIGGETSCVI